MESQFIVVGQFDDSPQDTTLHETSNLLLSSCGVDENSRKSSLSPEYVPSSDDNIVIRISNEDVLCGRGGKANNHIGNLKFRSLISEKRPEYFTSRKPKKTEISRSIVGVIRSRGGRFLKFDKETESWHEITHAKAVEKTSQALREGAAQKFRDILADSENLKRNRSCFMFGPSMPTTRASPCVLKRRVTECNEEDCTTLVESRPVQFIASSKRQLQVDLPTSAKFAKRQRLHAKVCRS